MIHGRLENEKLLKELDMKKLLIVAIMVGFLSTGCVEGQARVPAASAEKSVQVQLLKPRAMIILEKGLTSPDAKLRTNAIEVAAETGQKDMLPLITKLTTDPVVPVRFSAAVALGDMRSFSCENLIRKLLNDPDVNVRIAAAYALAKLNQPQYIEQLRAAAKSPDQTVRANATLLLGKLGNRDNLPLLYEVLDAKDSTDKVRMQAVESIARLGDERMYRSKLWALQISKFADDRVIGIRGMGALNTPESRDAIATMLQDDILEVRLAAAEQLARLADNRGKGLVLEYFQTIPDLNTPNMANGMAVMAIGYLKSNELNAFLSKALDSRAPYVQLLAAQSVLLQLTP
jgi:HEAT repeat protein